MVARHHARVHRVRRAAAGTVLELLESTDAFPSRRAVRTLPARLRGGCARPRARTAGAPLSQAAQLRAARAAAASVRLDPAVIARDQGPVIAERMRAARIEAIRSLNQA